MREQPFLSRMRSRVQPFRRSPAGQSGLTLMELMIVVAIIGILAAISVTFLWKTRQRAKEITLRHDLKSFALVQEAYFADTSEFAGLVGASIRNDGVASDFSLPPYLPSKRVVITITSGDPYDPYNESDPFTVEAHYVGSTVTMEFNFRDQQIIEK
jgi:prepilin-type N-terminal cleavage/methylation domain-containing protein